MSYIRPVTAQTLAFALDALDLTLIVAMAPVLGRIFLPRSVTPLIATLSVLLTYTVTTVFRPVGSSLFGNLGDKIGRRNVLLITITGFSIASGLTGTLPTYAQTGFAAFALLMILRMLVGLFGGGEYAGGFTYALEWTPYKLRGIVSGIVEGSYNIGILLAGTLVSVFLSLYGLENMLASQWRYVFFLTFIPLIIVLYLRFSFTRDSPIYEQLKSAGKVAKTPLRDIFRKGDRYKLVQTSIFMAGLFFSAFAESVFLPSIVTSAPSKLTLLQGTNIYLITGGIAFLAEVLCGGLSQVWGRRKTAISWGIASMILVFPILYALIQSASAGSFTSALLLSIAFGIIAQGPFGISIIYLAERFPASHRASGLGFSFSSGIFVAGWFGIYMPIFHRIFVGLDTPTNLWFSAAFMMFLGALLYTIGQTIGPETLGTKLGENE